MVTNIALVKERWNDAIERQTTTKPQMVILAIKKTRLHAKGMFKSKCYAFPIYFFFATLLLQLMTTCYKSHKKGFV